MVKNDSKKKKQPRGQVLACPVPSIKDTKPIINFKYLYKCPKGDFKHIHKLEKQNNKNRFEELQKFLYEADSYTNITELISDYTSRKATSGLEKKRVCKTIKS